MRVVGERQQGVEVLVHERADLAVGEAFRGRVDRQDEALVRAFFPRVREQDELPRHELAPVVVADGPGDEQQLAPLDGALEEGLARPGALDEPALVPQDRAEYAQPAARGDHPGADDTPHAGHLLAHARLRERRDPRGIEIAVRGVVQEIAHRPNAEPRERLGPLGPDALQVLDRRPERQIHHPSPFPPTARESFRGSRAFHRSSPAVREAPAAAATPTRPRTWRSPRRTTTSDRAARSPRAAPRARPRAPATPPERGATHPSTSPPRRAPARRRPPRPPRPHSRSDTRRAGAAAAPAPRRRTAACRRARPRLPQDAGRRHSATRSPLFPPSATRRASRSAPR